MRIAEKSKILAFYQERNLAYTQCLGVKTQFTHVVLEDLAKFCRAGESTFDVDPYKAAYLAGRRDVYLRVKEFLELNAEQLLEKNSRPVTIPEKQTPTE